MCHGLLNFASSIATSCFTRDQRAKVIFEEVCDLLPDRQTSFIAQACVEDGELRKLVEFLLEADKRAGDFLATPILDEFLNGGRRMTAINQNQFEPETIITKSIFSTPKDDRTRDFITGRFG